MKLVFNTEIRRRAVSTEMPQFDAKPEKLRSYPDRPAQGAKKRSKVNQCQAPNLV